MSKLAQAMKGKTEAREMTPYEVFRTQVDRLRPEIAAMVGKDGVDRFVRVCLNAVQANPKVLEADRRSLLLACMRAAQDRLLPDGRESVFNIYPTKKKAAPGQREEWVDIVQYLPMVGGLIKKLYDSGHVIFVDGVAVRERDDFEYHRGDEPKIVHKPYIGPDEPGKVIAAYAVIKLKNGEVKREVMSRRDIELVRSKSKAQGGLMWSEETGFYDQAAIKSVIKRAYKQLPSSQEIERVIASDNEVTGLVDIPVPAESGSADLQALVDGRLETEMRDAVLNTGNVSSANEATTVSVGGVQAAATAKAPEAGQSGTPELKAKFLEAFRTIGDLDVLDLKRDEINFFTWSKEDLADLEAMYKAKRNAIVNP